MDMSQELLNAFLYESSQALADFCADDRAKTVVLDMASQITAAMGNGNKVMIAGNGGSAADAQHFAGELISRLFFDHAPLAAIALSTDTSVMTAIANDYGYEKCFERQVLGLGKPGDVFVAISTSGNSPSILKALEVAREREILTFGFTGSSDSKMLPLCDLVLRAPSAKTAVIQQIHIVAVHLICGMVEKAIFQPMSTANAR